MQKRVMLISGILVTAFIWIGCDMTRGGRVTDRSSDSLFLGLYLEMEKQDFFERCWDLNKQRVATHGPGNESVEYELKDDSSNTILMRFYPTFIEDKIFEMPVVFSYAAWAPWNKQFSSDSLLNTMVPIFESWYGQLKLLNHKTMGKVYYRIDGKRRINLFVKDEQFVQAVFTDLRVEKKLKEKTKQNESRE